MLTVFLGHQCTKVRPDFRRGHINRMFTGALAAVMTAKVRRKNKKNAKKCGMSCF